MAETYLPPMVEYIRLHPEARGVDIGRLYGVTRQAVCSARKRAGLQPGPKEPPREKTPEEVAAQEVKKAEVAAILALPALPVVQEVPTDRRNWLRTEEGKNELAEMIGGKLKVALDALTPEKAARTNFKDLAISVGVLTDKLTKINDDTAGGVGMLAVALVKAVSSQMRTLSALLPRPVEAVDVIAEVVE